MKTKNTSNLVDIIKNCGLTEPEAKVYIALLGLENGTMNQIAKESGLNRTSSYAIINRLKDKGLISKIKKVGVTYFSAASPDKILQIQKENYQNLEQHMKDFNDFFTVVKKDPSVRFYEGKDGLKTVLDIIIKEAKDIFIFGDGDAFKKAIPGWSENYSDMRIKHGITSKIILKGSENAITIAKKLKIEKTIKSKLTKIRILPEGYDIVGGFDVFNDKVIFYSFDEKKVAVVVESPTISAMMRSVFNILWGLAEMYDKTLLSS